MVISTEFFKGILEEAAVAVPNNDHTPWFNYIMFKDGKIITRDSHMAYIRHIDLGIDNVLIHFSKLRKHISKLSCESFDISRKGDYIIIKSSNERKTTSVSLKIKEFSEFVIPKLEGEVVECPDNFFYTLKRINNFSSSNLTKIAMNAVHVSRDCILASNRRKAGLEPVKGLSGRTFSIRRNTMSAIDKFTSPTRLVFTDEDSVIFEWLNPDGILFRSVAILKWNISVDKFIDIAYSTVQEFSDTEGLDQIVFPPDLIDSINEIMWFSTEENNPIKIYSDCDNKIKIKASTSAGEDSGISEVQYSGTFRFEFVVNFKLFLEALSLCSVAFIPKKDSHPLVFKTGNMVALVSQIT